VGGGEDMKLVSLILSIIVCIIIWTLVVLLWQKNDEKTSSKMREIDYYLVLSRDEVGALEVAKHNPGDIIHTLCIEINRLRRFDVWEKIRQKSFVLGYDNVHNTPWNEFTIEEKVVIAMYGGSGSKLSKEEIEEFKRKYANPD